MFELTQVTCLKCDRTYHEFIKEDGMPLGSIFCSDECGNNYTPKTKTMTKKHISYPSIEQFRNIVSNVNREFNFVGLDDQGEAIYDHAKPKPILTFKGTVKLHGTNFGVSYNATDGMWAQSKENIITPEKDNAGSAFFVETNKSAFMDLFDKVMVTNNVDSTANTISIYGEWAGRGIQKAVAISNIEKSFFIFGVKITPHLKDENDKTPAYWVDSSYLRNPDKKIYNVEDYKTYSVDIDFNYPQLIQNKLIDLTIEVEDECPVGKAFGFEGIGEGIVFSHRTADGKVYRFKSKGEKHSKASKVTTLKPVDDVRVNKIIEIVNKVTPDWRMEQAMDKTFDLLNGGTIDIKKMGDFIRNVIQDIMKEESDTLAEAGLDPKDINAKVSEKSRLYFFAKQNEAVGL